MGMGWFKAKIFRLFRFNFNNNIKFQFLGIDETLALLKSEEWIYGKTPKFSLKLLDSHTDELRTIYVENGRIKESTNSEFPTGKTFHQTFLVSKYSELFLN